MKTQIQTLEKSDLHSKHNHTLAIYIASITLVIATYSIVTATQYL